jgi:hypothetical protein
VEFHSNGRGVSYESLHVFLQSAGGKVCTSELDLNLEYPVSSEQLIEEVGLSRGVAVGIFCHRLCLSQLAAAVTARSRCELKFSLLQ